MPSKLLQPTHLPNFLLQCHTNCHLSWLGNATDVIVLLLLLPLSRSCLRENNIGSLPGSYNTSSIGWQKDCSHHGHLGIKLTEHHLSRHYSNYSRKRGSMESHFLALVFTFLPGSGTYHVHLCFISQVSHKARPNIRKGESITIIFLQARGAV